MESNQEEKQTSGLPTILIVEDNELTMDLIREYFNVANKKGHLQCDIIEAFNGEEAIKILSIAQPEIILSDIQMPKVDGFGVLDHLNRCCRNQNPYCFFCFFSNTEEDKARAFKKGADGFLAKKGLDYFPLTLQLKSWLKLVAYERKYGES